MKKYSARDIFYGNIHHIKIYKDLKMRIGYFKHWHQPPYTLVEFLRSEGIEIEQIDYSCPRYLENFDVVLIEQHGFNDYIENDEPYISDWVSRGGILLFMHQDYQRWAPSFLPDELGCVMLIHRHVPTLHYSRSVSGDPLYMSYMMPWPENSGRELFNFPEKITPDEMLDWHVTCNTFRVAIPSDKRDTTETLRTAAQSCYYAPGNWEVVGSYMDPGVRDGALLLKGQYGKGMFFLCQLLFPEVKPEEDDRCIAFWKKFIRNLIAYFDRFKTGTPARVHRRSLDLSVMEEQRGEERIMPFSVRTDLEEYAAGKDIPCHIVYTNKATHEIINSNIERSAMYSGNIVGTGPRYCPSIETKLVRFADKERHQLFVEPCGSDTEEMYIQGFSTSMPTDVQDMMLESLPGFEGCEVMRYAYAIEYDSVDPTEMLPTLEFKKIKGLYGAGQFNGTSGYEEAAAQGLVAGINASLAERGMPPMVLPRSSSYIGTLIDDLVTKGTEEPYRMMTSRSEYRLLLRQDNADMRLTDIGRDVGLISEERYARFVEKREAIEREIKRAQTTVIAPSEELNALLESLGSTPIKTGIKLAELVRRPELSYEALKDVDRSRPELPYAVLMSAQISIKYEGYIKRELAEAQRQMRLEDKTLPSDIVYSEIAGLRLEAAEKLDKIRPLNVGQASRISGVNPADISVLLIKLGMG